MLPVETEEETKEGWSIQDLETADWALARLSDIEREREENRRLIELQVSKLKLRLEQLEKPLEAKAAFFKGALGAYAEANKAALLGSGKKKSRTLPHGSLGWRKSGGKLKVEDAKALLAWAQQAPPEAGLIRMKEEANVEVIKANLKPGEVPPGMTVDPEIEVFEAKPAMGTEIQ